MQYPASASATALERFAFALLALVAAAALSLALVRVPLWLEQPNEGWNAIHTLHAFTLDLYPRAPAWIINNYPPLSFYLVGALNALTGDPVLSGRGVALVSFAATALGIALILRRLGASPMAALLGALSFVAILSGLFSLYVGLSDPQMLAHGIVTLSVALLVGARRRSHVVMAALGVVAGLMAKQIVVALPLGATLWLFWHRREWLVAWVVTGALASAAALGLCVAVYGQAFIANITFPRILSEARLRTNAALISKPAVGLVAFILLASKRGALRDPAIAFAALAIGGGLLEILMFGSALGVGINIAFDLVIAVCIATGLVFDRLAALPNGGRWRMVLVLGLALRVIVGTPAPLNPLAILPYLLKQQDDVVETVALLKPLKGPIACEPLATCALAGHPSIADLWKLRFESTIGPFVDTKAFFAAIKERRFTAIVTAGNLYTPADDKFMPGLHDALHAAYGEPIKIGPSFFVFLRDPK